MAFSKAFARLLLRIEWAYTALLNPAFALTMNWYLTSINVIGGLEGEEKERQARNLNMRTSLTLHRIGVSEEKFAATAMRWFKLGKLAGWVVAR